MTLPTRWPLFLVLLPFLAGCQPFAVAFGHADGPADAVPTSASLVAWRSDVGRAWDCDGPSIHCDEPYLDLARARGADQPACLEAAHEELAVLVLEPLPAVAAAAAPSELRDDLLQALDLAWLTDGMDERALDVWVVDERVVDGLLEQRLLVDDPLVGTLQARLLWPLDTVAPVPAVLALPGHPFTDAVDLEFLADQHGEALSRAGHAVLVPTVRAYDAWHAEDAATVALCCAGTSLLAVRHYETLVLQRLLRDLQERGRLGRLAVVGHSGGSVLGRSLLRHASGFDAAVFDFAGEYAWGLPCDDEQGSPLCLQEETHPGLHPLRRQLADGDLVPWTLPVLEQPYGYPDGPDQVLDFLAEQLAR